MSKARLLITRNCNRSCSYCCNKIDSVMAQMKVVTELCDLSHYDEVMITGGEPMLMPDLTLSVTRQLRIKSSTQKIYLYSALWTHRMVELLPYVDGIHYTIHAAATQTDMTLLELFREMIVGWEGKSFRVCIDEGIPDKYPQAQLGDVNVKVWKPVDECKVPEGETLLIYKPKP